MLADQSYLYRYETTTKDEGGQAGRWHAIKSRIDCARKGTDMSKLELHKQCVIEVLLPGPAELLEFCPKRLLADNR